MSGEGKLTKADLASVSGHGRVAAQERWLQAEGIPFKRNGKGELVVLWIHVQAWVEGRERPAGRGINWAAV
jgi:hypothetical protein